MAELHHGWLPEGSHDLDWSIRDAQGVRVTNGMYLIPLESPAGTSTQKLLVLR